MKNATDWLQDRPAIKPTLKKSSRTRLQIVMGAEDSWLLPYLISTDVYICPSEARPC